MVVNREEVRKPRAYKICDRDYLRAMKLAKIEKKKLATMIEEFVKTYGKKSSSNA